VYTVAFAPDSGRAVSGGNDGVVRLWDMAGKELGRFQGHSNAVVSVAFSPDGRRLLSASSRYQGAEKVLRLWDVASGKELRAFGDADESVWCVAFSADGRTALFGSSDKTLHSWNLSR
jgi:WD40 repeat protein